MSRHLTRNSWWSVRRRRSRSERQVPDAATPRTLARSTSHLMRGDSLHRARKRLVPHAAHGDEQRRLLDDVAYRDRRRDATRRAFDEAASRPYRNRVNVVLWLICFALITPIEAALSKTLVDRLAPDVGGLLSWAAVGGVVAITILATHEVAGVLSSWTSGPMSVEERRSAVVVVALASAYAVTMNVGIAMTPAPPVTHVVLALVLVGSTLLYWAKPDDVFVHRLRCWFDRVLAEQSARDAARHGFRHARVGESARHDLVATAMADTENARAVMAWWNDPDPTATETRPLADLMEDAGLVGAGESTADSLVWGATGRHDSRRGAGVHRGRTEAPDPPLGLLRPPTVEPRTPTPMKGAGGAP